MQPGTIYPLVYLPPFPGTENTLKALLNHLPALYQGPQETWFRFGLSVPIRFLSSELEASVSDYVRRGIIRWWPCGWSGSPLDILNEDELNAELQTPPASLGTPPLYLLPKGDLERLPLIQNLLPNFWLFHATSKGSFGTQYAHFVSNTGQSKYMELITNARDLPPTGSNALCLLRGDQPEFFEQFVAMVKSYAESSITTDCNLDPRTTQDQIPVSSPISTVIGMQAPPTPWELMAGKTIGTLRNEAKRSFNPSPRTSTQIQAILTNCSEAQTEMDIPLKPAIKRMHIASMLGMIQLKGIKTDATFTGGSFTGFSKKNDTIDLTCPPSMCANVDGMPINWTTYGAVSLESEELRGLHESRSTKSLGGAEAWIDYLQTDTNDFLLLDGEIHFPKFDPKARLASANILSLPFDVQGPTEIKWYSGGYQRKLILHPPAAPTGISRFLPKAIHGPWHHLRGRDWTLASGDKKIVITHPGPQDGIHYLSVRMNRKGRTICIEVSPCGFYEAVPARWLSGAVQRFTLGIHGVFDPNEAPPNLDPGTETLLNTPYFGKVGEA